MKGLITGLLKCDCILLRLGRDFLLIAKEIRIIFQPNCANGRKRTEQREPGISVYTALHPVVGPNVPCLKFLLRYDK